MIAGSKALLHARNDAGHTALHLACFRGSLPTVSLLLDAGSDLSVVDNIDGCTPLHCAIRNGACFAESINLQPDILTLLKPVSETLNPKT